MFSAEHWDESHTASWLDQSRGGSGDYEPRACAYDQAATIWLDEELEDDQHRLSLLPAPSTVGRQWEACFFFEGQWLFNSQCIQIKLDFSFWYHMVIQHFVYCRAAMGWSIHPLCMVTTLALPWTFGCEPRHWYFNVACKNQDTLGRKICQDGGAASLPIGPLYFCPNLPPIMHGCHPRTALNFWMRAQTSTLQCGMQKSRYPRAANSPGWRGCFPPHDH